MHNGSDNKKDMSEKLKRADVDHIWTKQPHIL